MPALRSQSLADVKRRPPQTNRKGIVWMSKHNTHMKQLALERRYRLYREGKVPFAELLHDPAPLTRDEIADELELRRRMQCEKRKRKPAEDLDARCSD